MLPPDFELLLLEPRHYEEFIGGVLYPPYFTIVDFRTNFKYYPHEDHVYSL